MGLRSKRRAAERPELGHQRCQKPRGADLASRGCDTSPGRGRDPAGWCWVVGFSGSLVCARGCWSPALALRSLLCLAVPIRARGPGRGGAQGAGAEIRRYQALHTRLLLVMGRERARRGFFVSWLRTKSCFGLINF